jgi:hypothetical protein
LPPLTESAAQVCWLLHTPGPAVTDVGAVVVVVVVVPPAVVVVVEPIPFIGWAFQKFTATCAAFKC